MWPISPVLTLLTHLICVKSIRNLMTTTPATNARAIHNAEKSVACRLERFNLYSIGLEFLCRLYR